MMQITERRIREPWSKPMSVVFVKAALLIARILRWIHRPRTFDAKPEHRILIALIGPFNNRNWLEAYARPIAESDHRTHVVTFSKYQHALDDRIRVIVAPSHLQSLLGERLARWITFGFWCLKNRPHLVLGLHLPTSGFIALVAARSIGAQAAYFCVGGESEIENGEIGIEQSLTQRSNFCNKAVANSLVDIANEFDAVFTMGTNTAAALRTLGVSPPIYPIAVGIDMIRFSAKPPPPSTSQRIISVARLVPIKALDLLLEAVSELRSQGRNVSLDIVGDGPERERLEKKIKALGIAANVRLIGSQDQVEKWLWEARVFALASRSEGLPIAMLEALSCGIGVVAPKVGDIADAINDPRVGLLVESAHAKAYAHAIAQMLDLDDQLNPVARNLRLAKAREYSVPERAKQWRLAIDQLLLHNR